MAFDIQNTTEPEITPGVILLPRLLGQPFTSKEVVFAISLELLRFRREVLEEIDKAMISYERLLASLEVAGL